jgi:hypothetical protein
MLMTGLRIISVQSVIGSTLVVCRHNPSITSAADPRWHASQMKCPWMHAAVELAVTWQRSHVFSWVAVE